MTAIVLEYVTSLIDSLICIWFVSKFIDAKKNRFIVIVSILLYWGITLFCDAFLSDFKIIGTSILFAASLIYAFIICQQHYVKAILACAIYKGVFISLSSLLFIVISSVIKDFGLLLQGSGSTGRLIFLSMHKLIIISVFALILVAFKDATITDIVTGIIVFFVSVLTILGLGATMVAVTSGLYETNPFVCIMLLVTYILINICVYIMVNRVKKLEAQKYELKLLGDKYEYQQDKYAEALSIWSNIRKVQHDIKNHLLVIKGELNSGNIEECKEYVDSLIPQTKQMGKLVQSDNETLDYLINSKLCGLEDTQVIVSGIVGNLADITNDDIVSIVGNILDNAIEAIDGLQEKRIELLFNKHNDNRIITCKNTIKSSVLKNNKELQTSKSAYTSHGLGHIIVEETVTRLGGLVDYSEENNMFVVKIVLPIQR